MLAPSEAFDRLRRVFGACMHLCQAKVWLQEWNLVIVLWRSVRIPDNSAVVNTIGFSRVHLGYDYVPPLPMG